MKRKLLFFASDFRIGLSALLTDQLVALFHSGIDVCAVAGENEQEPGLTEKVSANNIPFVRIMGLDAHHQFNRLAHELSQIVLREHVDVVHVQNNWQLALIAWVRFKLLSKRRFKIVYTLHGFRHNSKWKSLIAQMIIGTALFLFADKVICMCSYLKKKFCFLSYKIVLLPLGIPDDFFVQEQLPLPANGLQMIFPAQFRQGKNQDLIIKAFSKHIAKTGDNISHLILPGNGSLLEKMRGLAAQTGIANRVEFPGLCTKEEIFRLYLKSNIGIVSSNSETFGQSIVEPFVLGRCVLSTPVGIANDIIKKGINGYLFQSENELADIFTALYKSPSSIAQMGNNNFREREGFRWKKICSIYRDKFLCEQ